LVVLRGAPPQNSRRLTFSIITHLDALPVRLEPHVANSITTMRRHLIAALAADLLQDFSAHD
jgi:hypothetical protein